MAATAFHLICVASVLASAVAVERSSNETWQRKYRVWFTRSWGDDHVCLTELVLLDDRGVQIEANLVSQSSCYGCSSCDGCTHRYGDPLRQFDHIESDDLEEAWVCTKPGSFVNGLGSANVLFSLPRRPSMMVLARPSMDGDWIAKDWSMEEQQDDGTWWVIVQVTDGPKALKQSVDVPLTGGKQLYDFLDLGPGWTYDQQKEWKKDYPDCGGSEQSPIKIDKTNADIPAPGSLITDNPLNMPLQYVYEPMKNRALFNTGLTVQVAGAFGNLTFGHAYWDVKQFHIHMPAEHQIGDERTIGELHIVHQKRGSRGTDDLMMVSIMLRLPLEHENLVGTEPFFYSLGLDKIPSDGKHGMPFQHPIDLNVFAEQLNGHYYAYSGSITTPPCHENVKWYVMATPAVISGANVLEFKDRFPNPMNNRVHQPFGDRKIVTDGPAPEAARPDWWISR